MKLAYKKYGEGKPLLILHGLLGAGGNWHTLARTEFSKSAAVYTIDLRNHGQSPHHSTMTYPAMSEDVRQFIVDHDLRGADVIGHSMGGKVAMQLAVDNEEVIDKLVVVDVAPRAYEDRHRDIIDALESIDLPSMTSRSEVDEALEGRIPSRAVRQFLLKNLRYSPEGYSWLMNLPAIRESYSEIAGPISTGNGFSGSALFVRGGRSDYLMPSDQDRILVAFPQARFVTVEAAGHWVHAEAPAVFAEVVSDFLNE